MKPSESISNGASLNLPESLRVLFVDDQADMRLMMQVMMQRRSYRVETAGKAREALQIAPNFKPHIVISDIGMPGMNGLEMMRELRDDERLAPFKAVALTGYDTLEDIDRAREAGFDKCFTKPIDPDYLFSQIEKLAGTLSETEMRGE